MSRLFSRVHATFPWDLCMRSFRHFVCQSINISILSANTELSRWFYADMRADMTWCKNRFRAEFGVRVGFRVRALRNKIQKTGIRHLVKGRLFHPVDAKDSTADKDGRWKGWTDWKTALRKRSLQDQRKVHHRTVSSYIDYSSLRGQNIPSVISILRMLALLSLTKISINFCIEILFKTFPKNWWG